MVLWQVRALSMLHWKSHWKASQPGARNGGGSQGVGFESFWSVLRSRYVIKSERRKRNESPHDMLIYIYIYIYIHIYIYICIWHLFNFNHVSSQKFHLVKHRNDMKRPRRCLIDWPTGPDGLDQKPLPLHPGVRPPLKRPIYHMFIRCRVTTKVPKAS